jgi:hypothetical protein
MYFYKRILNIFLLLLTGYSYSQDAYIKGYVVSETGDSIPGVYIILNDSITVAVSDHKGFYSGYIPCCRPATIKIKFLGYLDSAWVIIPKARENIPHTIVARESALETKEIIVNGYNNSDTVVYNSVNINTIAAKYLPSAFGDFTKVLPSMALGVSSNSELSSVYSVRGGNFDENLVYINDIEIYKPQLAQAGQQQGLSTVNPDLIKKVNFSSGGWESKYGDKLSSVLNAEYKTPSKYSGSFTAGFLGGAAHVEGTALNNRLSFVSGIRLKSSKFLLNTLDTKGDYNAVYWDWQSLVTLDLTNKNRIKSTPGITKVDFLFILSSNKYQTIPTERSTTFGTLSNPLTFDVAFQGQDILLFQTGQGGVRLSHKVNNRFKTTCGVYSYTTSESNNYDIEAGYAISSVAPAANTPSYNQNVATQGIGSYFDHGRDLFQAWVVNFNTRNVYNLSRRSMFEFGGFVQNEKIHNQYEEYDFSDSASYVNLTRSVYNITDLNTQRYQGYGQYKYTVDSTHVFISGVRFNYWTLNQQFLTSPRFQYVYNPRNNKTVSMHIGTGIYQQPAFFREMQGLDGSVNTHLKAQRSAQFIIGVDKVFTWAGRKFKFITEGYAKYMDRIVPYYLNDVRIQYFGYNDGTAYATGVDFRLNGEFVKGLESWFNLGIMTTKEKLNNDPYASGYIRRPTDQRVTASIFFQDHIPNNPSIKVYLNLVFGSGLPFGPPNTLQFRDMLTAPAYRRVDIGFTKLITFNDKNKYMESIWLTLEVLNLFGTANTISYLWVPDYNGHDYAIPNTLTARYLNLKTIVRF